MCYVQVLYSSTEHMYSYVDYFYHSSHNMLTPEPNLILSAPSPTSTVVKCQHPSFQLSRLQVADYNTYCSYYNPSPSSWSNMAPNEEEDIVVDKEEEDEDEGESFFPFNVMWRDVTLRDLRFRSMDGWMEMTMWIE